MSNEQKPKLNILSSIKSNWASMLTIAAAISVVINFYWKADEFIVSRAKDAIKAEISTYHKEAKNERDSIISSISSDYFKPLEKQVNLNEFFLNQSVHGLNAEFDPYPYKGKLFYRSNKNSSGYSMYWYIFERNNRWEIYQVNYNATCDCFEYYDIIESKNKRIK